MFLSFCYVVLRRVLQLLVLHCRSNEFKDLEIVVLPHELAILRRRTHRPALTWTDRLFLAAASRVLPRTRWRSCAVDRTNSRTSKSSCFDTNSKSFGDEPAIQH